MAVPSTVRLPEELDARLVDYCTASGAVKNRVIAIALRSWLDGDAPAAVCPRHDEPDVEDEAA